MEIFNPSGDRRARGEQTLQGTIRMMQPGDEKAFPIRYVAQVRSAITLAGYGLPKEIRLRSRIDRENGVIIVNCIKEEEA